MLTLLILLQIKFLKIQDSYLKSLHPNKKFLTQIYFSLIHCSIILAILNTTLKILKKTNSNNKTPTTPKKILLRQKHAASIIFHANRQTHMRPFVT